MPNFRTTYNYVTTVDDIETPIGVSKTLPDESLTIEQIMARHTSGLIPPIEKETSNYLDEPDFDSPDLEKLRDADLFEREMMSRDLARRNNSHTQKFSAKQQQYDADRQAEKDAYDEVIASAKKNKAPDITVAPPPDAQSKGAQTK